MKHRFAWFPCSRPWFSFRNHSGHDFGDRPRKVWHRVRPRISADFSAMAGKNVVDQFELFLGLGHLLLLFQVLSQTTRPISSIAFRASSITSPLSAKRLFGFGCELDVGACQDAQGSQQAPLGPPLPPAGPDPYCRQSTLSIALVNRHPPC